MLDRGWDVRAVVASRKSEYPWIHGPTLRELACERGLTVVETQAELPRIDSDFVISYMFRRRVTREVRDVARRAALNFHAAPLPDFGGWAFYSVAILEEVREYGCTCHHMDEGFDTGPLLKVRRFPIDAKSETAWSLESRTQVEMLKLFCEFCVLAESGDELPCEEQDSSRMRYMTREQFEALKRIPAEADPETIQRYARAFWYPPYEGAYLNIGGVKVEVVPAIEKNHLATLLHADEVTSLRRVAREFSTFKKQI
jgi:methionyl-tRNA formyltransferase